MQDFVGLELFLHRATARIQKQRVAIDAEFGVGTLPDRLISDLHRSFMGSIVAISVNLISQVILVTRIICEFRQLSLTKSDLLKTDYICVQIIECLLEELFSLCVPIFCIQNIERSNSDTPCL